MYPTPEEAKKIIATGDYKRIPVTMELNSDMVTPVMAVKRLKKVSHHCFMLESAEADKKWGRYTFLGFDPTLELTCQDGILKIKSGFEITEKVTHPMEYIRKIIKDNKTPVLEGLPPFAGGLVGYFSYDYIKYSEPSLKLSAKDEESFKDVDLMLFDKVIAFDHLREKIILIVNFQTDNFEQNYQSAVKQLEIMLEIIEQSPIIEPELPVLKSEFEPLFNAEQYADMVNTAKHYIREGDIFQVVLSNRMQAKMDGSLFKPYETLRKLNPSPYMFYFSSNDIEIAGASPETLVKLQDGRLYTYPLAGTRPRGKTPQEDNELEKDLLKDEKELAEHNMLVDLGRNDLGKISKFGTVKVQNYHNVLKFSHVMHIGSTVVGEIRDDKTALDAVDAVLPAGTLSGAPKIRAMQIINELENNKRGIYGGAIGYIDFTGNLDTCIAIRIAYKKKGNVFIRSGAGIVADSDPEKEHRECINKAQAVVSAIMQSSKEETK